MLARSLAGLLCTGLVTYGLGFWWVRHATQRPVRSESWKADVQQKKDRLLHEYHAQPITLCTQDGYTLAAYWIERSNSTRAILMCHGHHMVKEHMIRFIDLFPHDSLLLFDFRGHGASSGDITTLGVEEKYDVLAALNFIKQRVPACTDIFGFSFSMGGLPLLKVAVEDHSFSGLMLDGAFSNLETVLSEACRRDSYIPCTLSNFFMRTFFKHLVNIDLTQGDSAALIAQVRVPVLIIHSDDDEITNRAHAHILHKHACEPKHLWLVKGSKHGYIVKDYANDYANIIENFCSTYAHNRCAV